jgi:hypothetical protein
LPIYVIVLNTPGVTAVSFAAPMPACIAGAVYLSDTSVFPIVVGDSQTGVHIGFGVCVTSPIHVLTINLFAAGLTDSCCPYPPLPHPNAPSGEIEFVDCNANLITGRGVPSYVTKDGLWGPPAVDTPSPPDNAVHQPLDAKLSWRVHFCSCGLGVYWDDVYFGTDPDPPLVAQFIETLSYDPGPLLPGVTYYWKIRAVDTDGGTTIGPVWSFTTELPIAVEPSTWGRIKQLYTD